MANDLKSLNCLSPGQTAVVSAVASDHRELKFKILVLGLVPGTPLKVVSIAPLGDPITVEVRGTLICLRKTEAAAIQVKEQLDEISKNNESDQESVLLMDQSEISSSLL